MDNPQPLRILHISTPKTWRGGEQQLAYLLRGLELQLQESHVLCPADSVMAEYCHENNFPVHTFTSNGLFGLSSARQCARYAAQMHIDCVHTHDAKAHNIAVLAASIFGMTAPIVVSRRVDFPLKSAFFTQWKYKHPQVKSIVCVSKAIRDIVRRSLKADKRLEVVYSGIDIAKFVTGNPGDKQNNHERSRVRGELGLAGDVKLIGNVAALAPHKDHQSFLDAAEIILQANAQKVHFVLIGEGGEREKIESRIARSAQLRQHVSLLGFREDVSTILPELDVFLMTSSTEGLGTSILDAFAANVAVVATEAGGIPELVIHGRTGLSAKVADAEGLAENVLRLLQDEKLRQKLIAGAAQHVLQFDWKTTAVQTLDIYRACLQADGPV